MDHTAIPHIKLYSYIESYKQLSMLSLYTSVNYCYPFSHNIIELVLTCSESLNFLSCMAGYVRTVGRYRQAWDFTQPSAELEWIKAQSYEEFIYLPELFSHSCFKLKAFFVFKILNPWTTTRAYFTVGNLKTMTF